MTILCPFFVKVISGMGILFNNQVFLSKTKKTHPKGWGKKLVIFMIRIKKH
jgi:hypothetical protein